MAKEEQEEIVQENPPVKKRSMKKIIIIGVAALVVLGAGTFGALYFLGHMGSAKKAPAQENRPLIGQMWSIDPFIVNLADNQGERYLKVVMQLELADASIAAQLDQLKPKLRDNVMDLLTAKTYAELMEAGGKQRLRDEIALRLNSFLTKGGITKVYFTEFVIQ